MPGPLGPAGLKGEKGSIGASGEKGHTGFIGLVGPQGPSGEKGQRGKPGPSGRQGNKGDEGPDGEMGNRGQQGPRGPSGDMGVSGEKGSQGGSGEKGERGFGGPPGPPGPPGRAITLDGTPAKAGRKKRDIQDDDMMNYDYSMGHGLEEVFAALESLKQDLTLLKEPMGTNDNPARSCKDLWLAHPDFPNGEYFIDPNGGCAKDAIQVYCDLEKEGVTCIKPKTSKFKMNKFKKSQVGDWFSEDTKGYKFDYSVSEPQFKFLRLLSATGKQRFTYTCQNSIGWYDNVADSYEKAITLLGWNDQSIGYNASPDPFDSPLNVIKDECSSGKGTGKVVVELNTREVDLLPFRDYKSNDFGSKNQKHGYDLGEVCFSG